MFKSDKRTYELPGGVKLMVDPDRFLCHDQSREGLPTAILHIVKGGVSQADVTKAAGRVQRVNATATRKMIEVRTDSRVNSHKQAFDICDAFVSELETLLRDRIIASRNAKKAASRTRFVNVPQK